MTALAQAAPVAVLDGFGTVLLGIFGGFNR